MKRRNFIISTIGATALFSSRMAFANEKNIINKKPPIANRIIREAHRGASLHYPENTMLAFEKAIETGVDRIEIDLRQSSDGKLVVFHDETLDRTTNGSGKVAASDYSAIKKLDAGSWKDSKFKGLHVPLLEEVFELAKEKCMINIDLKDPNAAQPMIKLANDMKMANNIVITGKIPQCVEDIRKVNKSITMFYESFSGDEVKSNPKQAVRKIRGQNLPGCLINYKIANEAFIHESKKHGLSVNTWGALERKDMINLVEMGVDSIMTDDLALLNEVIRDFDLRR